VYYVNKQYGHELGLSACFRQPFAESHCREPHGYPLAFRFKFGAISLDRNNWVMDFGGLKPVKAWLCEHFDHRTILSEADPHLDRFQEHYEACGFTPILVLPFVGCEGFAKYAFDYVGDWMAANFSKDVFDRGLHLKEVEVREHAGNSAIYEGRQ
jgi:6-pyruvoyltetrahydropterin/6-carboxytetrahydropterin synthase